MHATHHVGSDRQSETLPEIAFDLDGVICQPPFGLNIAISRRLHLTPLPDQVLERSIDQRRARAMLKVGIEALKYNARRPLIDAKDGLQAINELRRPIIVTARSAIGKTIIERWLERHGLRAYLGDIVPNSTHLRPGHHKLRTARNRGILEHVDDDGSVAYYLAHHGLERVFLRQWMLNRGIAYPANVIEIRTIRDIADVIRRLDEEAPLSVAAC